MAPRAALLNDTDAGGSHFGCARVMACIRGQLAERGIEVAVSVPSATDWAADASLVDALSKVDLIVVNGEGTLHHGRPKGRWLLDAGSDERLSGARKVMVNMLWQDNPGDWSPALEAFDIVQARDSASAAEARRDSGREVRWFGDMSMAEPIERPDVARSGIVVGDSVSGGATAALAGLAAELRAGGHETEFLPVVTESFGPGDEARWSTRLRKWIAGRKLARATGGEHTVVHAQNTEDYLDRLVRAELSVTGRFHSVCLSLATRTPFVAVTSNSRKIEALVSDAGLDPTRIISRDALTVATVKDRDWRYSSEELAAIDRYLDECRTGVSGLFDDILALGQSGT